VYNTYRQRRVYKEVIKSYNTLKYNLRSRITALLITKVRAKYIIINKRLRDQKILFI